MLIKKILIGQNNYQNNKGRKVVHPKPLDKN